MSNPLYCTVRGAQMYEKLNGERERVSDVVRQEFADRLVATDEENRRLKAEMSETRARHRAELEEAQRALQQQQSQQVRFSRTNIIHQYTFHY